MAVQAGPHLCRRCILQRRAVVNDVMLPACSYEACTEEPSRASSAISGVLYQAPSPPSHTASASSSRRHSPDRPDQERARLLSSKVGCAFYCCSCQGVLASLGLHMEGLVVRKSMKTPV